VSDDNAFIEAQFKTLKDTPRYPTGGFRCIDVCRQWTKQFVQYYNSQHRHKGISWVTPMERQEKLDVEILERRSKVYAAARKANPNRWSGGEKKWTNINSVTLNGRMEPKLNTIAT
jgi:transposase InsO family protein